MIGKLQLPRNILLSLAVACLFAWLSMTMGTVSNAAASSLISSVTSGSTAATSELTHTLYLPVIRNMYPLPRTALGVQYYGTMNGTTGYDYFQNSQAGWTRNVVPWSQIEPTDTTPDKYQWPAWLDDAVEQASSENINIILTIAVQPSWAAEYPAGPPYNSNDLLEFVGAVVERYDGDGYKDAQGSPVARYFELYNEPDNTDPGRAATGGWGYWGGDGAAYGALAKKVYPVVKAASPRANLVMGGIALDWFADEGGIFDRSFLDDVLSECEGCTCFDYANFHYYPLFHGTWDPYGVDIVGKTNYVRAKLSRYGVGDMPILVTELGWISSESSAWGGTELQARYAVQGFVRGMSAQLDGMIWFKASDHEMDELPGLLDENYAPKASYHAFATTARFLSGATYQRSLNTVTPGASQIEGYVFSKFGRRLDVVWTNDSTPYQADDNPSLTLVVSATSLRVVDKMGNEQWISDADDGNVNGQITLIVGGSPLFLEYH